MNAMLLAKSSSIYTNRKLSIDFVFLMVNQCTFVKKF